MTLNADMSFWINTMIFNKLCEICPDLDLNNLDRKIYDICIKDFKNYVIYLDGNHTKMQESAIFDPAPLSSLDDMISIMIGETSGLKQNLEDTKEVTEFVDMWVHWWWGKWVQRTKIILNESDLPPQAAKTTLLPNIFSAEEHEELMRILKDKLIQYGEICCTEIMADALFKKAIEEANATKKKWDTQEKINFISKLQREAKQTSYTHGPLVFIRPDNYFKLREWRNDNTNVVN